MMRYRTYEAETLQQAILKMTIDLGKDALLVSHRTIKRGGFLGIRAKRVVEVTGALPVEKRGSSPIVKEAKPKSGALIEKRFETSLGCSPSIEELVTADIREELKEIKTRMDMVLGEYRDRPTRYPGRCGGLYLQLIRQEVDEKIAEKLIKTLIKKIPPDRYEDIKPLKTHLRQLIADMIKVDEVVKPQEGSLPAILAFIGPTGVGKTTTLSKLAADFTQNRGMEVVLVTIDTYRIAAVEQLKRYAEILDIPLEVVFTPEEFQDAIEGYLEADLILVDTAGCSQRNLKQIEELRSFINGTRYKIESVLVLSATTKCKDMFDIVNGFKGIPFHRTILTKLDETATLGPALNLLSQIPQDLSYVTMGQNVPEDIEMADPDKIARTILNEKREVVWKEG